MSRPQGHGTDRRNMSLKNPVTPPGIHPGTIQLVAQRLNHYSTPGPYKFLTPTNAPQRQNKNIPSVCWLASSIKNWVQRVNQYVSDLHKIRGLWLRVMKNRYPCRKLDSEPAFPEFLWPLTVCILSSHLNKCIVERHTKWVTTPAMSR